jgi:hypothetical protein
MPSGCRRMAPLVTFFLKWRIFLYVPRQMFEHLLSRESKARFLHVHVVVTARHPEKGNVKVILGKSAPGIYRVCNYEPEMLDVWPCSVPTKITLNDLDKCIQSRQTPYNLLRDNCIHFSWKLHKELCEKQESYEWNDYGEFWDRIVFRYMLNEELLRLLDENNIRGANTIKEILQNLDRTH